MLPLRGWEGQRRGAPARAAGIALLFAFAGAGIAAAVPPGLSVAIGNGVEEVGSDSEVVYTAELSNRGQETVAATMVITVPDFATITEAEGAEILGGDSSWAVVVEPGGSAAVSARVRIGEIPDGLFRVTTLVGVHLGEESTKPVIRSADSDTIPGVTDPSTVVGGPPEEDPRGVPDPVPVLVVGGSVLAVALALAAVLSWWRGRHQGTSSTTLPRP